MFIRCPAQCEAGSSVGKWAIITISWDPLSWGQFGGLLSMSYKWIQLAGSYLNATICDMHLFKFSYKPHSKWEDQLFIFCQLRWTVSNSFSAWPLSFDIWKWFLQNLWKYLFLSPRMLWTFYLSGFYPILSKLCPCYPKLSLSSGARLVWGSGADSQLGGRTREDPQRQAARICHLPFNMLWFFWLLSWRKMARRDPKSFSFEVVVLSPWVRSAGPRFAELSRGLRSEPRPVCHQPSLGRWWKTEI